MNYHEELLTLVHATTLQLATYPSKWISANKETKAFFSSPLTKKEPPPVPKQPVAPKIQPPPPPAAAPAIVPKEEVSQKKITSTHSPQLRIAARPFHIKPHQEEKITLPPACAFALRKEPIEKAPPRAWSTIYPEAIILNTTSDHFLPFIDNVSAAVQTRLARTLFFNRPEVSDWAEIITYCSTKIPRACLFFTNRNDEPYAPIHSFVTQEEKKAIAPLIFSGMLFQTALYEVVIDHSMPESKAKKAELWKALSYIFGTAHV